MICRIVRHRRRRVAQRVRAGSVMRIWNCRGVPMASGLRRDNRSGELVLVNILPGLTSAVLQLKSTFVCIGRQSTCASRLRLGPLVQRDVLCDLRWDLYTQHSRGFRLSGIRSSVAIWSYWLRWLTCGRNIVIYRADDIKSGWLSRSGIGMALFGPLFPCCARCIVFCEVSSWWRR